MTLENISFQKSFGGWHKRYRHRSVVLNCDMVFAVYLPPQVEQGEKLPVLYWLSGLSCTDENFMQKAGAQRMAAELGVIIVAPDTSPRGPDVPGDPDGAWDFGLGAGFYLNATQAPWDRNYRMHDYVVHELPALIESSFPVSSKRCISGHSMGGHGALVCALRNPGRYQSVSAFSPICNPMSVLVSLPTSSAFSLEPSAKLISISSASARRQGPKPRRRAYRRAACQSAGLALAVGQGGDGRGEVTTGW